MVIRGGESQYPLYACSLCLDQVKLPLAKAEFQKMETAGIINCFESDSPWASPLYMVPNLIGPGDH